MSQTIRPGLYQHFKGGLYRVLDVGRDTETEDALVIYQAMYGEKGIWVRPLSIFDERIERRGESLRRFTRCENQSLSLEASILTVRPGQSTEFESAFHNAKQIIQSTKGYLSHELRRCEEQPNQYLFLVHWESTAHHEEGFRRADAYQEWRALLHHFYEPMPMVQHYGSPLL